MIGFRVDANEKIASGHLMRCMAVAIECIRRGEKCIFFLAEEKGTERLKENHIPYRILNTKWNDLQAETEIMRQVIEKEKLNWLVVDSYQATASYLAYLEKFVPVLYFDDIGEEMYPVSAVLHYGQWGDEKDYQKRYDGTGTKVLGGMQYIPLRDEFSALQRLDSEGGSRVEWQRERSILITTGATDPYNVTGKLLEACSLRREFRFYDFEVIVGGMNQYENDLMRISEKNPHILLHKNIRNMSEYMKKCELAVSAGGTTLFELCACQIPTVCFSFADNQRAFVREMGKRKIMCLAGDAREEAAIGEKICEQLIYLQENEKVRREYVFNMSKLVDGRGVIRIADFLCTSHLTDGREINCY